MRATRISVVVPTLNEEDRVLGALRSARDALGPAVDLVVADGGSRDRTRRRARELARVVRSAPGRGRQLNAGARSASGDVLVFLHADTRLERDSRREVLAALAKRGTAGGCFRFAVDPPSAPLSRYRLLEAAINLRTALLRTATGDQAIFTTRRAFERAGGYPEFPLFEDVAFVRRLRRLGRFRPIAARARTSRRRWARHGFWRTVLTHWCLRLAFGLGVSPHRLARWYGLPDRSAGGPGEATAAPP